MNTQLTRNVARAVVATLAAVGAATTLAGTAAAADLTGGSHRIDTDFIAVRHDPSGVVLGASNELLRDGSVQAQLHGRVTRKAGGPGCVFARVVYTYANGSTETKDSPRACVNELAFRTLDVHSSAGQDLVRYAVQLRAATDSTAPSTAAAGSTYFVGDAPDSLGTKERLDHDTTNVVKDGATLFRGSSDYSITNGLFYWSVRSRVVGELAWSDRLPGTRAKVRIIWTYTNGSTSSTTAGSVGRGGAPVHIDKMSDPFKDVASVKIEVFSVNSSQSLGTQAASPTTKFGDYLSS